MWGELRGHPLITSLLPNFKPKTPYAELIILVVGLVKKTILETHLFRMRRIALVAMGRYLNRLVNVTNLGCKNYVEMRIAGWFQPGRGFGAGEEKEEPPTVYLALHPCLLF